MRSKKTLKELAIIYIEDGAYHTAIDRLNEIIEIEKGEDK